MEKNKIDQKDADYSKELSNQSDFTEEQQQQQQTVRVLEEEYSISKETSTKEAKIEKRWANKTKIVKVPISYEELYINGKKLKSVEESQILSALKNKITSISKLDRDSSVKQSVSKKSKIEDRGELVPLLSLPSDKSNSETEKIIPLYEEQFEISKKMVKVAEIVIRKRIVTEKKKIDIDIIRAEVTIKHPSGQIEKL
jgi:stress response protein YsnF